MYLQKIKLINRLSSKLMIKHIASSQSHHQHSVFRGVIILILNYTTMYSNNVNINIIFKNIITAIMIIVLLCKKKKMGGGK